LTPSKVAIEEAGEMKRKNNCEENGTKRKRKLER
jgi:hypothetical protein